MFPLRSPRPLERALPLAGALALALAFAIGAALPRREGPAPPPAPPAPPTAPTDGELIRRATREAHANCAAAGRRHSEHAPLFRLDAALEALDTARLEASAYGELEALRTEARWLASLQPESDLGERSWEDVRFLLGAIHDYLERSLRASERDRRWVHTIPAEGYDAGALRAFRGLDFGDLLGLWD